MPSSFPLRQTALSGPLDALGRPSIFDWTGVPQGFVPVTQQISPTHPLIVTASRGFGATGPQDRVGVTSANLTWPAVPPEGPFWLFVDVQSAGTLTPGFTSLEPIYQEFGDPSLVAGQHTYNITEATMHVGTGTTAKVVWRVFLGLGWSTTEKARITALRPFGYLSRHTTPLQPFPGPASYCRIENDLIPGCLKTARWVAVCSAADGHYLPGNELPLSSFGDTFTEVIDHSGYVRVDTAQVPAQILGSGENGTRVNLNPAHWMLKCYLTRDW